MEIQIAVFIGTTHHRSSGRRPRPPPTSRLPPPTSRLPPPASHLPSPTSHLPSPTSRLPSPASHLPSPTSHSVLASLYRWSAPGWLLTGTLGRLEPDNYTVALGRREPANYTVTLGSLVWGDGNHLTTLSF